MSCNSREHKVRNTLYHLKNRPGSWRAILHRAKACAWCTHLETIHGERCALDGGEISLADGTCDAWVLDREVVYEMSAHEKAEAILLKQATYSELEPSPS